MPKIIQVSCKTETRLEQIIVAVKIYAILKRVKLSNGHTKLMALILQYGIDDKLEEMSRDMKLYRTNQSYKNALTYLKGKNFLTYDTEISRYSVHESIKITKDTDIYMSLTIQQPRFKA